MCFYFLYKFCLKHFSFQEDISEIWQKNIYWFLAKVPLFLSDLNETWIFWRFSKNIQISNFMKIRPVEVKMFYADTHTDTRRYVYSLCVVLTVSSIFSFDTSRIMVDTKDKDNSLSRKTAAHVIYVFCISQTQNQRDIANTSGVTKKTLAYEMWRKLFLPVGCKFWYVILWIGTRPALSCKSTRYL